MYIPFHRHLSIVPHTVYRWARLQSGYSTSYSHIQINSSLFYNVCLKNYFLFWEYSFILLISWRPTVQSSCSCQAALPLHVCWRAQTEPWSVAPLLCVPPGTPAGSRPWSSSLALSAACRPAAPKTPEHLADPHLCILQAGETQTGQCTKTAIRDMTKEKWGSHAESRGRAI